ncbi:MAG: enoyl-CoA hydratase-related protein [Chloroflexi bacterium]|nr:enoyl-CoA hydratase-related protein [Chloroflexota bacterium]MCI0578145.1 enoyl-CoA hydratase-related protein [Chloroflexota bacterium]MCI0649861.1 enoyl-CoA hydratase-related protein [Chloroflexota bacterium]MCI0730277.1 enoyl-CoA hydratase-related protein [Chloroflexota bacterium]
MYTLLTVEQIGSVARVYLNRPDKHNALNQQLLDELYHYFTTVRDDRQVRVIVLGANGRTFCAGIDLAELTATGNESGDEQAHLLKRYDDVLNAIKETPQVVIADVHGAVIGAGVGLVSVADISVASPESTFSLPEVRWGLDPSIIFPYVISRTGPVKARQLFLTGKQLKGTAAIETGLIDIVCPPEEMACATQVINDVLKGAPSALAACKVLIMNALEERVADTAEHRQAFLQQFQTNPETREGMLAFSQRRQPLWVEAIE